MKDNLQDKLVEILTGIQGAVAKGSDFVLTQLPDVAQQYILFGRTWSLVALVLSMVMLTLAITAISYAFISKDKDNFNDPSAGRIVSGVVGSVGALFSSTLVVFSIREVMLVWLAPKVWLLTEIATMLSRKH